jgi:hypothetical protein
MASGGAGRYRGAVLDIGGWGINLAFDKLLTIRGECLEWNRGEENHEPLEDL